MTIKSSTATSENQQASDKKAAAQAARSWLVDHGVEDSKH
jgi:hypothetical protein